MKWTHDWCQRMDGDPRRIKGSQLSARTGALNWTGTRTESTSLPGGTSSKYGSCHTGTQIAPNMGTMGCPKGPRLHWVLRETVIWSLTGYGAPIVRRSCHNDAHKIAEVGQSRKGPTRALQKPTERCKLTGSENEATGPAIMKPSIFTVASLKNLTLAYENLKSKPGNMTPSTDGTTLDGISLDSLRKTQQVLIAGKMQVPPARRIYIPKGNAPRQGTGSKVNSETGRPLGIASPRIKLVQGAVAAELSRIYEPLFTDTSHGFRPGRGCHTALAHLDSKFQSVRYVIQGDISKCFDRIPHKPLLAAFKEEVECQKLLSLIRKFLEAGYIEFGHLHNNLGMGTPQGSVLSPLLCNVYLHKLDVFMEEIKSTYNRGEQDKVTRNKEYIPLSNRIQYLQKKMQGQKPEETIKQELDALIKTPSAIPSKTPDENYIRIQYLRYADDFIIGVQGPRKLAVEIEERVADLLAGLELELNRSKTRITD